MGDGINLDIGGIASGVGEGIEHTLDGVGTLAERINKLTDGCFLSRKASKQVEAARVKAEGAISILEDLGLRPTEADRRASAFFAMQEIKGFENIEETLALADIPKESRASEIEDEWLSEFLNAASRAFSNWKRRTLANAVNEKALDPDCMSMDALFAIAKMEARHMDAFERICALRPTVNGEKFEPMILAMNDDLLDIVGLSIKDIRSMESIGILREIPTRLRKKAVFDGNILEYFGNDLYQLCEPSTDFPCATATFKFGTLEVEAPVIYIRYSGFDSIVNKNKSERFVDYGFIGFTETGRELSSLVSPSIPPKIDAYVKKGMDIVQKEEDAKRPHIAFAEREYGEAIMKLMDEQMRRNLR